MEDRGSDDPASLQGSSAPEELLDETAMVRRERLRVSGAMAAYSCTPRAVAP